ncbi:MAG: adenylyl cyclase, partial [Gammaproteobacteria bacterium]|nr:adenylyl cyclase [Gammaproteobacteria bacterium]
MSFFRELKERNVFKVGVIYIVTAWLLVQVASIALPTFEAPAWVLRVFMFFLLLGFPVALIMAWALELTPEGIKRAEVTVGEKRMWTVTAVLAIAAIAWFELAAPGGEEAAAPVEQVAATSESAAVDDRESIAVLPFVNMSTSEENEYFSDGLTETLLHMLAQVD